MTKINLLPWREELRQERKKEFLGLMLITLILTSLAGFAWVLSIDAKIEAQVSRNNLLRDGIKVLDAELREIKELKRLREQWIARMDVIQALQGQRTEIVKIFDSFVKSVPDGVFFQSMVFKGDKISLVGYAESNNRISALMRSLDDSTQFRDANLQKIKADNTLGDESYRFELKVLLKKPESLSETTDNMKG